jgi:hypothetical protein
LRRSILTLLLRRMRRHWVFFYTVQNRMDEKRLRGRGKPWPTGYQRAHLGPGVYAWRRASDARAYRRLLLLQEPDLRILRFLLLRRRLESFTTIDVDAQPDPDSWMSRYSLLASDTPLPHGAQYVLRHTAVERGEDTAIEHYFAQSVFRSLVFFRGHVRAH